MHDDNLVKKCLSSYSSVRSTFDDLMSLKRNAPCFESAFAFWQSSGRSVAYAYSELNERYSVLFWVVCNVCLKRHLRQKQLLVLGPPGTHKTNLVQSLSKFLPVYFLPRRPKDFSGANKDYALWVMDEFSGSELDLETLNMLLDGQPVRLDSKYGRIFEKTANVPVIMLGNSTPYLYNTDSFRSRVFEVHFFSQCKPIDPGRLAATFCALTARLSLTISVKVAGFAIPSEGSPVFVDYLLLLSNCFGRPISSLKSFFDICSDSALMKGLSLPFNMILQSKDLVFAENEKSFKTKFSCSFGNIPLKFLSLPVYVYKSSVHTDVLSSNDPSSAGVTDVDGKDESANVLVNAGKDELADVLMNAGKDEPAITLINAGRGDFSKVSSNSRVTRTCESTGFSPDAAVLAWLIETEAQYLSPSSFSSPSPSPEGCITGSPSPSSEGCITGSPSPSSSSSPSSSPSPSPSPSLPSSPSPSSSSESVPMLLLNP